MASKVADLFDGKPPGYSLIEPDTPVPGQMATKIEIFAVAAGWLIALISAVFYTAAICNTMGLTYQPYVTTSSIPRVVTWNGTVKLLYVDKALAQSEASNCSGTCLLDPYDVEASAACTLPTTGLLDTFQQLFFRIVTFSDERFVSSDMDSSLSYGLRLSVVCFGWGYAVISLINLISFSGVVLRGGRAMLRRDAIVFHPMFNVVRGIGATLLFTFGTSYSMILNGNGVMNDVILSASLIATLFLASLIQESRKGAFFSVNHSPAYDHSEKEDKPGRPHVVHHLTIVSVVLLFMSISVVAIVDGVQRTLAAENYAWVDPGIVHAYNDAVTFKAPYMARTFSIAMSMFSIAYLVVPPLLPMISVFELMNHAETRTTADFATHVREYRVSSLIRQLLLVGALCLIMSVPPIAIPASENPPCSP